MPDISVTVVVVDGFAQPLPNPVRIPNPFSGTLTFKLDPVGDLVFEPAGGGITFQEANAPFQLRTPDDKTYVFDVTNDNESDKPVPFTYEIRLENPRTHSAGPPQDPTVVNEPPGG